MTTTAAVRYQEGEAARLLKVLGPSPAVTRFADSYASVKTRRSYLQALLTYLQWLSDEREIRMTPDQLLKDNLHCIFDSPSTEVTTKRKHLDWLSAYINRDLVDRGIAQGTREVYAAVITQFYAKNDSALWGHFSVSRTSPKEPAPPLDSKDIREVLKHLPLNVKPPLLVEWQSSIEIDRVLGLRWKDVMPALEINESPLQVTFYGRKKHRRQYSPMVGRDSVEHLRLWSSVWAENMGREPEPEDLIFMGKKKSPKGTRKQGVPAPMNISWLNARLKLTAMRLHGKGLIQNGNPQSWHTHYLRHSFSTECSHAGVKPEVREYWMGHLSGISWVYQHPELHREDLVAEYRKVEPYVSMDYVETTLREEYDEREKSLLSKVLELERNYEALKKELLPRL